MTEPRIGHSDHHNKGWVVNCHTERGNPTHSEGTAFNTSYKHCIKNSRAEVNVHGVVKVGSLTERVCNNKIHLL